jgi:hypothetical protein
VCMMCVYGLWCVCVCVCGVCVNDLCVWCVVCVCVCVVRVYDVCICCVVCGECV